MVLLNFVLRLGIPFRVFHFIHRLRSDEETTKDLNVINSLLDRYGYSQGLNVEYGENLDNPNMEMHARTQRFAAIRALTNNAPTVVMTAHHLNDNIEGAFINLVRGRPHSNLSMLTVRENLPLIKYKPFLPYPKENLIHWATVEGIEWNEDVTNKDCNSERNWWRNVILPQIMERRNLEKSMARELARVNES